MIRIEDLGKRFGSRAAPVTALTDVSLDLTPGVWAIVGPNGAGKTTLLGLVLGFLRPSSGSIAIEGGEPRRWVRRHGAGYLPERFRLPPEWSVEGALRGLAGLHGLGDRVEEVLDRLGLTPFASRPIGTLSRGLNQRLGLAQALLSPSRLVVLDEPTEGLDPLWRVRFREIVRDLRRDDRTILLASHELAEVDRLADRAIVLDRGRVVDVVEVAGAGSGTGPRRYRLVVDGPDQALDGAFPGATVDAEGAAVVEVADPAELSHRLAAFLEQGGILHDLRPAGADLETRVRERLEDDE